MAEDNEFQAAMASVLGGLVAQINEARRIDPCYAKLFECDDVRSAVDDARSEMRRVASNLLAVLRDRHGMATTLPVMHLAYGLPLVGLLYREHIQATEGLSCCEDKTRAALAAMFKVD